MKLLLTALLLCGATVYADDKAANKGPAISQCFKVHWLLKTDDTHYWADWVSECPYEIEAVYVMVGFSDPKHNELGNGVWPMYFVRPGAHQVTRFSVPVGVDGFEAIVVHHITTDSTEAFSQDKESVEAVQRASSAQATAPKVSATSASAPRGLGDSGYERVIHDPGSK